MSWDKGSATIEALIDAGMLQRVTASTQQAQIMLDDASRHVASAAAVADADPLGAYVLTYDAGRKALASILEAQGLRATVKGGHIVLFDAAMAQFDPPLGTIIKPFNRIRARRNQVEYASGENPEMTSEEVLADLEKAAGLIELARKVLPQLGPF